MNSLHNLFNFSQMTDSMIGRSIEIYAPFHLESCKKIIPKLVLKGIITRYFVFNTIHPEGNCISILIPDQTIETIIYGEDFETFRNYKKQNKELDQNTALEYMRVDELLYKEIS